MIEMFTPLPGAGAQQHFLRDVDADDPHIARIKREGQAGADADLEDALAGPAYIF